jgi:hypothetical protein
MQHIFHIFMIGGENPLQYGKYKNESFKRKNKEQRISK